MTTTKPARQRPDTTPVSKKAAPAYKRLNAEAYAQLTADERARHDLHLDVDAIIDALPRAQLDRDSIGFRGDCRYENSGGGLLVTVNQSGQEEQQLNGVEAASQQKQVDTAVDWLAAQKEARSAITVAGRSARFKWPNPPDVGVEFDGVTVGARSQTTATCPWCSEVVVEGRNENTGRSLIRRIDGTALHDGCYKEAWRQAKRTDTSITAIVTATMRPKAAAS